MLAEIEDGIISFLGTKVPQVGYADSVKSAADLRGSISYSLAVVSGTSARMSMSASKVTVQISVWIIFKNFHSDKMRRGGIFPVLESIVSMLYGQKLGLDIHPLDCSGFSDVTTDAERAAHIAVYQINLTTAYEIHKAAEDTTRLLTVALDYYLDGAETPEISGETISLNED